MARLLHFLPRGIELFEERDQILNFLLVLDAGEDHLRAGHLDLRVLEIRRQIRLIPCDAGVLVGV